MATSTKNPQLPASEQAAGKSRDFQIPSPAAESPAGSEEAGLPLDNAQAKGLYRAEGLEAAFGCAYEDFRRRFRDVDLQVAASGAFVLWTCTEILGVAGKPEGPTFLGCILCGVVYTFLVASTLEWLVHRFLYHEGFQGFLGVVGRVHTAHHVRQYPPHRYASEGPPMRLSMTADVCTEPYANYFIRAAHFGFYMSLGGVFVIVPAWLATHSICFTGACTVVSLAFSDMFIRVHDTIHRPGAHPFIESCTGFPFLNNHHWLHHIDPACNFNILLPFFDVVAGTIRYETTTHEDTLHGSLREAQIPKGLLGDKHKRS